MPSSSKHSTFIIPNSTLGRLPSLYCITQDSLPLTHLQQAELLCRAGARLIQLRIKNSGTSAELLYTAKAFVAICRAHGATSIINDHLDIALASDADGLHLGATDHDWRTARAALGSKKILGGTVNNASHATAAKTAACLDYVGLGPWRFTTNKKNLAPILSPAEIRALIAELAPLPVYVIGGIESADVAPIRALGAHGVAISSALYRDGNIATAYTQFQSTL